LSGIKQSQISKSTHTKIDQVRCTRLREDEALYKFTTLTRAVSAIIKTDGDMAKSVGGQSRVLTRSFLIHGFTKELEGVFYAAWSAAGTNKICTIRIVVVGSIVHDHVRVMR